MTKEKEDNERFIKTYLLKEPGSTYEYSILLDGNYPFEQRAKWAKELRERKHLYAQDDGTYVYGHEFWGYYSLLDRIFCAYQQTDINPIHCDAIFVRLKMMMSFKTRTWIMDIVYVRNTFMGYVKTGYNLRKKRKHDKL